MHLPLRENGAARKCEFIRCSYISEPRFYRTPIAASFVEIEISIFRFPSVFPVLSCLAEIRLRVDGEGEKKVGREGGPESST
jgi:hypothetical protein